MNRYESFCEELFPTLYKVAYLITGDSSVASELAVCTVVQGVHHQRSIKSLADARIELMRILYAACMETSFDTPKYEKLSSLDYQDRCFFIFRHCSGLKFQEFCRVTAYREEQARRQLTKIVSTIHLSKS